MAIARWEPFRELARIQDEFNRLFEDRRLRGARPDEELGYGYYPPVDIYEDQEGIVLTAELPGMDSKELDLRVEDNVLTLQGSRKLEKEDKRDHYHRIERAYGTFCRSFTLPATVDTDKVRAEFRNGLVRVMLPKKEESKPRSIKVKVE